MTDFTTLRTAMVDCQIRPSDVTKFPIIDAMLRIPREAYVPAEMRAVAYAGDHLAFGRNRVVMDPRILAKMLDALDVGPTELALDLGCGLGYSTAVIAHMAEAVIAVEQDEDMATEAEANFAAQSVDNAIVTHAQLTEGAAKHGPYDVITVNGGVEQVPDTILDQLKMGGRIAAIFVNDVQGQRAGHCRIGTKTPGGVAWHTVFDATAPVLPGFERTDEFAL